MEKYYLEKTNELIKGSYDLHIHTTPSHFPRSIDDFELLKEANKYGMKGVLIKNHYQPTEARAMIANKYALCETKVFGGITLNWPVGGLNVYAVESSLRLGAKVVWMPTRDAKNSLKFGNMPGDFFTRVGLTIYDNDGKIKPIVYEILEVVKKYDAYIATGHLSAKEAIELCKEARKMKVKVILTHPDWVRTIVPLNSQIELAEQGVLIEKVWINIAEGMISSEKMAYSMKSIGYDNVFMVTDRGQANEEKPIEGMLRFIEAMLRENIAEKDIKKMIRDVPKLIVG